MKCWVYWIHLESHTDILNQGYVGITTLGVDERFKRHISASKVAGRRQRICNAIVKYKAENLIVETILIGSKEYCQDFENKLRPQPNIGWNLSVGGALQRAGSKNSAEHVAKVVAANTGKKRSLEVVNANRVKGLKQFTFDNPWEHPYSNKAAWALALEIHDVPAIGRRGASKRFSIPVDSAAKVVNKIKTGWNPCVDASYLSWLSKYKEEANGSQSVPTS